MRNNLIRDGGICLAMLVMLAAGAVTYPIVDTGQTTCYGANAPISAPAAGAAFYGQDGQISGRQPSYRDNGDGTATDLHTGLTWVKARGSKVTWDAAAAGAATCRVGGYTDWRMPTIKELYSLIQFTGKSGPTDAESVPYIDTNYFEIIFGDATGGRVIDGQDWSATQYVSTTMQGDATVFGVNFIDGRIKGYPKYKPGAGNVANTLYVRYVRGNTAYGVNYFVDNGATVTDTATGLQWAKADSGTGMNWQTTLAWVQTQNAANYLGHNDWRLPNAKELQSIVDYTRSPATTASAAIDPVFSCTQITNEGGVADYPFFWTGTTHLDSMGAAYIAFGRALGYMKLGTTTYYTLLDVHGAGCQRSDPKSGSVTSYYLGVNSQGNPVYGLGPQGDVIRIENYVRLVRDADVAPTYTYQPDLFFRRSDYYNYIGANVYNANASGQALLVTTNNGSAVTFYLRIENDGTTTDTFTITAPAVPSGWTARYYNAGSGGTDITSQITGAGWSTGALAAGATRTFRVAAGPKTGTTGGSTLALMITAVSTKDAVKTDAITPTLKANTVFLPDGNIRNLADSGYLGDNVCNVTGADQTKTQRVSANATATYIVRVQNDGNSTDTLTVTANGSAGGWTVKYTVIETGTPDITAQIAAGWSTGLLAPGAYKALRVEVTPAATVSIGATKSVTLTTLSTRSPFAKKDAVKAVTTRE